MVVLAALAASFSTSTRTQVNLARNLVEAARAEAIADAGVARAAAGLVAPLDQGGMRADGTVYAWQFAGGEARFSMTDEGGKIDLNMASRTLFRDLLSVIGVDRRQAETLAGAILAYRGGADGDEQVDTGADVANGTAEFPDESRMTPFALVDELQQVPGMTGDIYQRLAPAVTIYSGQTSPDDNAALPEVRASLAASRGQREREGPANEPRADEAPPLPAGGPLSIVREGSLAARSAAGVFTVHCEGRGPGDGLFARDAVIAIEYGDGKPYSIRLWRQGRRQLYARRGKERQLE